MAHPVHSILRRVLGTEQFAFDSGIRELWPSERFPPFHHAPDTDGTAEPRERASVHTESEP